MFRVFIFSICFIFFSTPVFSQIADTSELQKKFKGDFETAETLGKMLKKIKVQQTQLDAQQTQLDAQQTQIKSQRTQIKSQQDEIDAQRDKILSQKSKIDEQLARTGDHQTEIDALQSKINSLQNEITAHRNTIDTQRNEIEAVRSPSASKRRALESAKQDVLLQMLNDELNSTSKTSPIKERLFSKIDELRVLLQDVLRRLDN